MPIFESLRQVDARISAACRAAQRRREEVCLELAVKTRSAEEIAQAAKGLYELGLPVVLGQNHAQECVELNQRVLDLLSEEVARACTFHYIGSLQSNKMSAVLRTCQLIETVESPLQAQRLARRLAATSGISRETGQPTVPTVAPVLLPPDGKYPVFLQVNASSEPQKGGCVPEEVLRLADAVEASEMLQVRGLMTLGCAHPAPGEERVAFDLARQCRDRLALALGRPLELSMGMSQDLEAAIACGSTIVRLGTAVFGVRSYPSADTDTPSTGLNCSSASRVSTSAFPQSSH